MIGFALTIAAGLVLVLLIWWAQRRRAQRRAWADRRGYRYGGPEARDLVEQMHRTPGFAGVGSARRIAELIAGTYDDQPFVLFEYVFTTGAGRGRSFHHHTLVQWRVAPELPAFVLAPEGWLAHLRDRDRDLDFADDPEFSKAFLLHGAPADATRALFTPERRQALLALTARHDVRAIGAGPHFYAWRAGGLPGAAHLDDLLAAAARLRTLFTTEVTTAAPAPPDPSTPAST